MADRIWKFSQLQTGVGVVGTYYGMPQPQQKKYIVVRSRDGNKIRIYFVECDQQEEIFWNCYKADFMPNGEIEDVNFRLESTFRPTLKQYKQALVNWESGRWTQDKTMIGELKRERANAKRS